MKNFPFLHEGKEYWYSRSIAAGVLVTTVDNSGNKYLLTIKRGSAVEHPFTWSVPCGYLDFDETIQECAFRELYEEAGINLKELYDSHQYEDVMKHCSGLLIDDPTSSKKQVVTILYKIWVPNGLNLPITNTHCDFNEIEEVKWLRFTDYDTVEWAFNDLFSNQVRGLLQI